MDFGAYQRAKDFTAQAWIKATERYPDNSAHAVTHLAGRFEAIIELMARDVPGVADWLEQYGKCGE